MHCNEEYNKVVAALVREAGAARRLEGSSENKALIRESGFIVLKLFL